MDDVAPVHVLVVDDVAASRGLASIWLSDGLRGGVEVVEAATLAEMRAAWAAHRPDVVVLDQRLPDGEGLDGARELLAEDPDATIILLTGMADPALDQEAERVGVADFLVKQEIDGPMLARTVRYALRRREDRRRLRRSEERYRNLVKELPDTGVLVVDEHLRFVMVAGAAIEQAGHDTEAMVGQSVEEVLERAGRPEILDYYRDALAGIPGAGGDRLGQRAHLPHRVPPARRRGDGGHLRRHRSARPGGRAAARAGAGADRLLALGRRDPGDDVVAGALPDLRLGSVTAAAELHRVPVDARRPGRSRAPPGGHARGAARRQGRRARDGDPAHRRHATHAALARAGGPWRRRPARPDRGHQPGRHRAARRRPRAPRRRAALRGRLRPRAQRHVPRRPRGALPAHQRRVGGADRLLARGADRAGAARHRASRRRRAGRRGDGDDGRRRHPARASPLPPRRPRRLGVGQRHAGARRARRAAARPGPDAGRHRAARVRGAAAPPRRPRSADRPAEPARLRARAGGAHRADAPLRRGRRAAGDRPRRLQVRQRHARPPRRRPADRRLRVGAARAAARDRRARPARRRRVRGAAAGRVRARRGGRRRRAGRDRPPTRSRLRRPAGRQRHRVDRRGGRRRRDRERRRADGRRRPRDVRGQGGGAQPVRRLPGRQQPPAADPGADDLAAAARSRARRGAPRAARAADRGPAHARDRAPRGPAAHGRR